MFYNGLGCVLIVAALCFFPSTLVSKQEGFNAPYYPLNPPFARFVSAGFWPAVVDLLWIDLIQEIGGGKYSHETLPRVQGFYDLATDLDPNFYELYEQGGVFFYFYLKNPEASLRMFQKGISVYEHQNPPRDFWTHPYSLYIFEAYVYGFEMQDWVHAKEAFLKAAEVPSTPSYLDHMKVWLKEKGSEKVLATKILKILIQNASDPVVKQAYEEKLKKL